MSWSPPEVERPAISACRRPAPIYRDGKGLQTGMVTIDCAEPRALARFWSAALDVATVFESDELVLLGAGGDGEPELGLQQVPEARAG